MSLKAKSPKRPRNLAMHLLLMAKSKRGGGHVNRKEKRETNRTHKEIKESLC